MIRLSSFFSKYSGFLRSFKIVYTINNFLNRKQLKRNKELYEKFGLKKSIFSSIGKKDFNPHHHDQPLIDQPVGLQRILADERFQNFEESIQDQMIQFEKEGFMVLKQFYTKQEIDNHNLEIERLLKAGVADFNYTGKKLMETYRHSEIIREGFFLNKKLLSLFELLIGKKPVPFHTINFLEGSEQKSHSDSIHMTTEPEGYLIAAWTALESTDNNNGPLHYYPKSHKWPYVTCQDYDSGNNTWMIGGRSYKNYEEHIEKILAEKAIRKEFFFAEPGDVFIWHANLIHGGEAILEKGRTRKSMVAHYFFEDVICYHEISQRPALLPTTE